MTVEKIKIDIKHLERMQSFLMVAQYSMAVLAIIISACAYGLGYYIGHGVMMHDCQDIVSSSLPVPSPIYAFKE